MGNWRVRGGEKTVGRNLWEESRTPASDIRGRETEGRSKGEVKPWRGAGTVNKNETTDTWQMSNVRAAEAEKVKWITRGGEEGES